MRKRTVGVTIFGIIFIISGLYSILLPLIMYEKLKPISSMVSIVEGLSFIKYFPLIISPFTLIEGLFCIIMGIGMFRLRFWAWYLVIANQIIGILSLPNTGFIFGWQAYDPLKIATHIGLIAFILWFFMRPKIREQFLIAEERFKLKSWYAALIALFLVMTLAVPGFVIGYKVLNSVKRKQPFLVKKPELIKLAEMDKSSLEERFRMREIFNLSFLVPKDFVLRRFDKNTGVLTLGDITDTDKGFIMIEDKPGLDITRGVYKVMQFENTYQFEEALYSNNWGIILLILRDISLPHYGDGTQIRRFETSAVKGFVKYRYRKDKDRWIFDCSVYDKLNNGMGNIVLILKGKDFSQDEALNMISSIQVSKKANAEEYYQNGIRLLDEGDSTNAQFAFVNAYSLTDMPEAGYMLAKTILMNAKQKSDLAEAKRILKEVLTLKPDYPEAEELLSLVNKEIEAIEKKKSLNSIGSLKKPLSKRKNCPLF